MMISALAFLACAATSGSGVVDEPPRLTLSVGALALLQTDTSTKGGGLGGALELSWRAFDGLVIDGDAVVLRARIGALAGAGVATDIEVGAAWQVQLGPWHPDVGLYGAWLGGDIVRSADGDGRIAGDPLALCAGLSPLRFRVGSDATVSFAAIRAGPTLARSGAPPLFVAVTLFEVGRRF